jgi:hypothetical protein
VDGQLN